MSRTTIYKGFVTHLPDDNTDKETTGRIEYKDENNIVICVCDLCHHFTYEFCPIRCPHCNAYVVEWKDER